MYLRSFNCRVATSFVSFSVRPSSDLIKGFHSGYSLKLVNTFQILISLTIVKKT